MKKHELGEVDLQISEDKVFYMEPTDIKVNEHLPRWRQDPGDLSELLDSIQRLGQMQPIVINRKNELIFGGRRLAACGLGSIKVKCLYKDTIDPIIMREMELEENLKHKQFTASEEVIAIAELHKLKQTIYGEVAAGRKEEGEEEVGWSLEDTAKLLGKTKSMVSQNIKLAETIEFYPELKGAKTKKDIVKAAKGVKKLAERLSSMEEYNKYITGFGSKFDIKIADAIEDMFDQPDGSIDLLCTDPPYGINIDKIAIKLGQKTGGELSSSGYKYRDTKEYALVIYDVLAKQSFRFCKEDGHAYVFVAPEHFQTVRQMFILAGWEVYIKPIIWTKGTTGQNNSPDKWPSSCYEMILFARKKASKLVLEGKPDWNNTPPVPPSERLHEAEKPTALIRDLISRTSMPGAKVYDPFMGSGPVMLVAMELGMFPIGRDELEEAFASTVKRLYDYMKARME